MLFWVPTVGHLGKVVGRSMLDPKLCIEQSRDGVLPEETQLQVLMTQTSRVIRVTEAWITRT